MVIPESAAMIHVLAIITTKPGLRDQHAGCVGNYLFEHDLCDFLLLSLPDNDTYSHKNGPYAQVQSLAEADKQIERLMHAAAPHMTAYAAKTKEMIASRVIHVLSPG